MDLIRLSKTMSYALRHAPWEYELELDEYGWVDISQFLFALKEEHQWKDLNIDNIIQVVNTCAKKRFEVNNNKIRALYGHSIPQRIIKTVEIPPEILFHGTPRQYVAPIFEHGLIPKGRQYVHLSADTQMALQVGKRRDNRPVLLIINAEQAWKDGVKFYKGNDRVWLADAIASQYIRVSDNELSS